MRSITKDLGTYYVRVQFSTGDGFFMTWNTCARYFDGGTEHFHPLTAFRGVPLYENEEDLFESMKYMLLQGNSSCDCNLYSYLDEAHNRPERQYPCGNTAEIVDLRAIRPDGSEKILYRRYSG